MFSWSSSKQPPAPAPGASNSTSPRRSSTSSISRRAHLSSYLEHPTLKPSTRKVSSGSDDTMHDTVFQTTNGFALIVRVYLPADNGAPTMALHGVKASHNWLDIRMNVIGYAPITSDQRWRTSGLKLGDAVYAVIHHFQLTPPSILEITDVNLKRLQESLPRPPASNAPHRPSASANLGRTNGSGHAEPPRYMSSSEPPRYSSQPQQHQVVERPPNFDVGDREVGALIPDVPPSFPQIDNMTLSELSHLAEDGKTLRLFVKDTSEAKTLIEIQQSILTANAVAAKENLVHEGELEGTCVAVESLREEVAAKMERYRALDAERAEFVHPPDRGDAIKELNKAKKEAFRESERLADDWIDEGEEDVGDFVKRFMEVRLKYHVRAAKAERLENSM